MSMGREGLLAAQVVTLRRENAQRRLLKTLGKHVTRLFLNTGVKDKCFNFKPIHLLVFCDTKRMLFFLILHEKKRLHLTLSRKTYEHMG